MSKKKNKIPKITEEQYYAYVMSLRNTGALFDSDGRIAVPDSFTENSGKTDN